MATAVLAPQLGTADLANSGASTAVVADATIGGFGLSFGLSFGAATAVGPVTAAFTTGPSDATLASDGAGGSLLHGSGVGAAALAEVSALTELQLV